MQKDSFKFVFTSFGRECAGGQTEWTTLISCSGKDLKGSDSFCSQRSESGQLTVHFRVSLLMGHASWEVLRLTNVPSSSWCDLDQVLKGLLQTGTVVSLNKRSRLPYWVLESHVEGDGGSGINVAFQKQEPASTSTRLKRISMSLKKMANGSLKECKREGDQ